MAPATTTPATDYVEEDGVHSMDNPNRKSRLFFGLCDMRTATVALNILNIFFTVMVAIVLTIMYAFDDGPYKLHSMSAVLLSAIIESGVSGVGLYSAMNWRFGGMVASTVALVAVLLVRILRFDLVDAAVGAVLLYPHVVFTSEMWSGVMTPETFAGEEFVAEGGRDFVEMANNYVSPVNSFVSA